ncbi:HlyD family efflux transporter periplasmic adaptor subunit [Rhodobacter sp. NSM]|uniref:HlyD family efflux transporter periplasmic adaptor subunit n=1 Tax=Rhodobacter sp. NSM TaxID=3457501 RepID=UPI003FD3721C
MNAQTSPDTIRVAAVAAEPRRRKTRRILLMAALPAALLGGAGAWWLTGGRYETTDNAYLHQAVVSVASQVSGRVTTVSVADNRPVREGDVMFVIDPEPWRIALARAEADVASARLQVEQLKVAYAQALAQEKLAADDATYLANELARQKALSQKGVAATTALDDARHESQRANELLVVARQTTASALAALGGLADGPVDDHPMVRTALAARDDAAYQLSLTEVRAPADGLVYQAASFKPGQMVTSGQSLFSLVETGDVWIDANFKETQLAGIVPGQKAEVTFDLHPGREYEATVEAVGAGTGSEFSLLPAQNATGNWVKVTQRVPVRLRFEEGVDMSGLASGLSAEVSVDTGRVRHIPGLASFAATAD